MRGTFITLEGADGCGKSTQVALLADAIQAAGREVVCLREPGGTSISEKIRALVLDPDNAEMAPECELLLFEASRAQLVRQVIEPALARGAVVLCDRFYDSTYAYQAAGRALDARVISQAGSRPRAWPSRSACARATSTLRRPSRVAYTWSMPRAAPRRSSGALWTKLRPWWMSFSTAGVRRDGQRADGRSGRAGGSLGPAARARLPGPCGGRGTSQPCLPLCGRPGLGQARGC